MMKSKLMIENQALDCPNCQSIQFKPTPEKDVIEQEIRGIIALKQNETTVNNTVEFRINQDISNGIRIGTYLNLFGKMKVEFPMLNGGRFSEGNRLIGTRYFKVNNWFVENESNVFDFQVISNTNQFMKMALTTNSDQKNCWKLTSYLTNAFNGKN